MTIQEKMETIMSERESKDLALPPNEHAFVMDMTKGQVNVYTGPNKASLSQTDQPVKFNEKSKRFDACSLSDAKVPNIVAPENWYIALKNPARDTSKSHPPAGSNAGMPDLDIGHKINIPGPASFALWPGQMARLIKGHNLTQNQYLLIRVYDEQSAKENFSQMVVAPQTDGDSDTQSTQISSEELVKGKLMVVKGTDVSFYMPPTGIEVVRTSRNQYVRHAVTLERLEYCLLLDQNGSKRYVQGPDVVFPKPTEEFVTDADGNRKFRAIELNNRSGIYVKVIAPYNDDDSPVTGEADHNVGDELFITGKEQAIYFPREEHSIIKYGEDGKERHFGVAIPTGEARYVLHRETGDIRLEKGPSVFLPDPRTEVIVRRILDQKTCSLLYPGNAEALQHNLDLAANEKVSKAMNEAMLMQHSAPVPTAGAVSEISDSDLKGVAATMSYSLGSDVNYATLSDASIGLEAAPAPAAAHFGNAFSRGNKYSPPRTITLNTKYDGAVTITVFEGYAVMLTNKSGARRVIQGPETALLEYDESPHFLGLSTGKPKTTDRLKETAYLKIRNNPISDIIEAETSDFCNVQIHLTYRVNFTGDPEKWFSVENYVKLLCHNMRSIVRNFVKGVTVEDFYQNNATLLRDLILGENKNGTRDGRLFEENGMHIHDVEILDVTLDSDIEDMLIGEQRDVIRQTLELNKSRRELNFTQENEDLKRQIAAELSQTSTMMQTIRRKEVADRSETALTELNAEAARDRQREVHTAELQEVINQAADIRRLRAKADEDLKLEQKQRSLEIDVTRMEADATNTAKKAAAVSADLIAALQSIADTETTVKVAEALGTTQMLKVVGGESIADVLANILEGSKLGERLGGTIRAKVRQQKQQLTD